MTDSVAVCEACGWQGDWSETDAQYYAGDEWSHCPSCGDLLGEYEYDENYGPAGGHWVEKGD